MSNRFFLVEESCSRLDQYLSDSMEDMTRSSLKKLIDRGQVTLNGKTAKASQSVASGDEIYLEIPEAETLSVKPENIPIKIVYQDEDIAVVNKPQGMTVHMGNGNYSGTLVNALLYHLDSLSGINGVIRPGIVHRIDKDTSGLLVVAKNDKAHVSLSKQIAEKTCHRIYLALLEGCLKTDEGRIVTQIGRSPNDRIKMAVLPDGKGKTAITEYEVAERFEHYTLVRFILQTGRTHQIRVHAKFLGHPVVGDPVYGYAKQRFHLKGQLLHAQKLILTHPVTGEEMTFEAPLPDYFEEVLEKLRHEKN